MAKKRHGISTIHGLIGDPNYGWAPASDGNDVGAYEADVARRSGFAPNQQIDLSDRTTVERLLPALIRHEQGSQPFTSDQISAAVQQAQQKVQVEVTLGNAPPGTTARARDSGGTSMPVRIQYTDTALAGRMP